MEATSSCSSAAHNDHGHHHMDAATAYDAAKLGMWLFLATEVLLFAALFASFFLYRWAHLEEFHEASQEHLDWVLGSINTVVLLFSSYLAAKGVEAGSQGDNKKVIKLFSITILCGFAFLGIKYIEYKAKYEHGLFPGGEHFAHYKNFFGLYFCMTGLHAIHVIIGMSLLAWVCCLAKKGKFTTEYSTPVELSALYWHLVDLIWIYLFPLLYLVG